MSDRSSEQRATEGSDRVRAVSLEDAFDEPAFVPYLAAGDPTYDASLAYVEALERGGADVVELGLPFSEPMAEGTSIQDAVTRALDAGMTPDRYFEFCEELDVDVPLVCMTYYNLVHRYGADDPAADRPAAFVERAAEAGVDGFVVPDLPAEEADPLCDACDDAGLDLVFIVAPTTTDERLARILDRVSGYLYVQARLGVTGARDDLSDRTAESLARLEDAGVPRAVGFGIKTGAHARAVVEAGADGVIVGSALVDRVAAGVESGTPTDEVAAQLEAMARELKEGALAGGAQRAPGPERT